jgi:uncharacterized membrane protein
MNTPTDEELRQQTEQLIRDSLLELERLREAMMSLRSTVDKMRESLDRVHGIESDHKASGQERGL